MTTRCFTMVDQGRFAALSGDCNPLHLDPLAARRTMLGGVVVHGVHLLLWALDELAKQRGQLGFSWLRVHFDRGAAVGDTVGVDWHTDQTRLAGRIIGDTGALVRITLTPTETAAAAVPWTGATALATPICEEHDMRVLGGRAGEIELALPEGWQDMFAHLATCFPPAAIAVLLASSRLVGMICPGLHSIYSGMHLTSDPEATEADKLRWAVTRADARVGLVDIELAAGGLRGMVMAFLRPKPYAQPRLADLGSVVPRRAFAGQRAIVIGGSRGLGELAAKLLAVGGAHVTITWRQGEAESLAIVTEAAALGLAVRAERFDIAVPPTKISALDAPYTHMYYFATPHIRNGRPGYFEPAIFATLIDAYVGGLARCVAWLMPRAVPDALIWYPSTVFVEQPDENFAEYVAAKVCGEVLCTQLAAHLAPLRLISERLPRLASDQTQSLTAPTLPDGVATLRAALLRAANLG